MELRPGPTAGNLLVSDPERLVVERMKRNLFILTSLLLLQSCDFDPGVESSADAIGTSLLPRGRVSQSTKIGGNGGDGTFGPIYCPAGNVLVGFDGDFYRAADDGAGFCEFKAVCARLSINATTVTRSETTLVPVETFVGDCGGNRVLLEQALCPAPQVIVGFAARQSGMFGAVTQLELRCGAVDTTGSLINRAFEEPWGQLVGTSGSRQFSDCDDPSVAVGIQGVSGVVIDELGLLCQRLAPSP